MDKFRIAILIIISGSIALIGNAKNSSFKNHLTPPSFNAPKYKNCKEILAAGAANGSKTYTIYPNGNPVECYCDMESEEGGWTLVSNSTTSSNSYPNSVDLTFNTNFSIVERFTNFKDMQILLKFNGPTDGKTTKIYNPSEFKTLGQYEWTGDGILRYNVDTLQSNHLWWLDSISYDASVPAPGIGPAQSGQWCNTSAPMEILMNRASHSSGGVHKGTFAYQNACNSNINYSADNFSWQVFIRPKPAQYKNCKEILAAGAANGSKTYTIYPDGNPIECYCDMDNEKGGWTLVSHSTTTSHKYPDSVDLTFDNNFNIVERFDDFKDMLILLKFNGPADGRVTQIYTPSEFKTLGQYEWVGDGILRYNVDSLQSNHLWWLDSISYDASVPIPGIGPAQSGRWCSNAPMEILMNRDSISANGVQTGTFAYQNACNSNIHYSGNSFSWQVFIKPKTIQYKNCKEILAAGAADGSKTYTIYPDGNPVECYCDMDNEEGGWTLVSHSTTSCGDYPNLVDLTFNNNFNIVERFADFNDMQILLKFNGPTEGKVSTIYTPSTIKTLGQYEWIGDGILRYNVDTLQSNHLWWLDSISYDASIPSPGIGPAQSGQWCNTNAPMEILMNRDSISANGVQTGTFAYQNACNSNINYSGDNFSWQVFIRPKPVLYKNCKEILAAGAANGSKVYTIYPDGNPIKCYCDMDNKEGGWTLVSHSTTTSNDYPDSVDLTFNNNFSIVERFANFKDMQILLKFNGPTDGKITQIYNPSSFKTLGQYEWVGDGILRYNVDTLQSNHLWWLDSISYDASIPPPGIGPAQSGQWCNSNAPMEILMNRADQSSHGVHNGNFAYQNACNSNNNYSRDNFSWQVFIRPSGCPDYPIDVVGYPIRSATYQSSNVISSSSNVAYNSKVNFSSAQTIILKSGFSVDANSSFSAKVEDCPVTIMHEVLSIDSTFENNDIIQANSLIRKEKPFIYNVQINPNPLRDNAFISYQMNENDYLEISLFDFTGKSIHQILPHSFQTKGNHQLLSQFGQLPIGMYFLRFNIGKGKEVITKKIIIQR
jgi:ribosomal protein S17E